MQIAFVWSKGETKDSKSSKMWGEKFISVGWKAIHKCLKMKAHILESDRCGWDEKWSFKEEKNYWGKKNIKIQI